KFAAADPKARVKWAGPDMSTRSSITARQMETWAHAQEVFDVLGLERTEADRIKNIAHLGVSTYGWTCVNRGEPVPEPAPYVRLTGPSDAIWEWGEASDAERVEGSAVEFAQVTAQTRNIADTALQTTGPNAKRWMSIAQCFAGPPNDPPAPGARVKAK
ncbi:MAG: maleylpyruvate isomerase family mycothiol-dependent enzyme, partial [Pseudomonadota bacterium]